MVVLPPLLADNFLQIEHLYKQSKGDLINALDAKKKGKLVRYIRQFPTILVKIWEKFARIGTFDTLDHSRF